MAQGRSQGASLSESAVSAHFGPGDNIEMQQPAKLTKPNLVEGKMMQSPSHGASPAKNTISAHFGPGDNIEMKQPAKSMKPDLLEGKMMQGRSHTASLSESAVSAHFGPGDNIEMKQALDVKGAARKDRRSHTASINSPSSTVCTPILNESMVIRVAHTDGDEKFYLAAEDRNADGRVSVTKVNVPSGSTLWEEVDENHGIFQFHETGDASESKLIIFTMKQYLDAWEPLYLEDKTENNEHYVRLKVGTGEEFRLHQADQTNYPGGVYIKRLSRDRYLYLDLQNEWEDDKWFALTEKTETDISDHDHAVFYIENDVHPAGTGAVCS